jgi:ribosomal protein L9
VDLEKLIKALGKHNVEFVIVGGVAAVLHVKELEALLELRKKS